ncbi:MAG: acetylglutamate kinase [Deltaproteobacteria bacterium]|nr:MAG: acetylglutamate kinase [Deltaproteobacteria bacterium]
MQRAVDKARVLIEALPYIRTFRRRTFVVKVGGRALEDLALRERLAEDLILLSWVGVHVVVVHGGGSQVSAMLDRLGIAATFRGGLRVTDERTLEVVEMVLGGTLNKEIVRLIDRLGGRAVGLTGKDGGMVRARRHRDDLGLVGEVAAVDPAVIDHLLGDYIPVIAPLAIGADGETLNVNADPFAAALAAALDAEKLVLLTDVEGVLDADGSLISTLRATDADRMIADGTIGGGMIPKVQHALAALTAGVRKVHIIDGRVEHALLLEIFTNQGIGTQVVRDPEEGQP